MRMIVCDETGLVKRVDFGESTEAQAVVVKYRVQHRPTAPLVASFDRHPGSSSDAGGVVVDAAAADESVVLLGLADGSVESLHVGTGQRVAVLRPGTFAGAIVSAIA